MRHRPVKVTQTHSSTLTSGTKRPRSKQRLIVGGIVLAIAVGTLWPSRHGLLRPFSFCLTCDFRWLADAVLNVGLFVPFGIAAGWRARSLWRVVLAGALFSTTIELLQIGIPGRDPALRDIVSNAGGAALGAILVYRPRAWLAPSAQRASWFANATALVIFAVISCTAVLLAPAEPQVPPHVSRAERDAIVRYQSHADVIGLDEPAYYVAGIFADADPAARGRAELTRPSNGWCLRVDAMERCGIGPTVGRGWSALIYPAAIPHRWADAFIDIVWTAALFFPLGFWTTRRTLALSFVAAIVLLGVVPVIIGLVPTTLGEWLGAYASIAAGGVIAHAIRSRYLPIVRTTTQRVRPMSGEEPGQSA